MEDFTTPVLLIIIAASLLVIIILLYFIGLTIQSMKKSDADYLLMIEHHTENIRFDIAAIKRSKKERRKMKKISKEIGNPN